MSKAETANSVTFAQGTWHEGSPALIKPRDHGFWLASAVFDGARALAGAAPDLKRHCQRLIKSGLLMSMQPSFTADEIFKLAWDAVGSEFASRHTQYEMVYAGATFVTKNHSYRTYDWDESKSLVNQILNNYSLSDET